MNDDFNNANLFIKNALEYCDNFQPKIQKILDQIETIEIIDNQNITDEIIFYDLQGNILLKTKFEILSIYEPNNRIWKWSWSVPTLQRKHTFISRGILDYALKLNSKNDEIDFYLKNTLVNSKINISNKNQIDILLSTSSYLCKKPFIFKYYLHGSKKSHVNYKELINDPLRKKMIVFYLVILDWNIDTIET